MLAEGTPLWKHIACLGARQAKAASLPGHGLRAHPPQQSSGFLPPLPPPLSAEELLIDLGPFLKVAARVTPLSAQPTCRATSSPEDVLSALDKYEVRDGHSNQHTLPVFPWHHRAGPDWSIQACNHTEQVSGT